MSECCGAIVENKYHAAICVLKEKYRKTKNGLKNVLRMFLKEIAF